MLSFHADLSHERVLLKPWRILMTGTSIQSLYTQMFFYPVRLQIYAVAFQIASFPFLFLCRLTKGLYGRMFFSSLIYTHTYK